MPLIITPDNSVKIDQIQDYLANLNVSNLSDVDLTNLANGKVLKYNSTTLKWECSDDAGGIGDVPDSSNYVRQLGNWQALGSTTELTTITNNITNLQTEQVDQNLIIVDHESRITNLEAENPEALRGLTDTNFGTLPDSGKDQYTVKYDYASDKFMLLQDNSGLPDAPIDGQAYV